MRAGLQKGGGGPAVGRWPVCRTPREQGRFIVVGARKSTEGRGGKDIFPGKVMGGDA